MRIMLRPQFRPDRYTLARSGPALIIDGTAFDFSQLDDGEFLPREAVSSPWVTDLGITHVVCAGIFTDQCVASTVRSLADESFDVIVVEDGCAAGTAALHERELEIINMIYASVMSAEDLIGYLPQ